MSDLLLRRLRKDLLLNIHLPEYDGIDKAVEEETGKDVIRLLGSIRMSSCLS